MESTQEKNCIVLSLHIIIVFVLISVAQTQNRKVDLESLNRLGAIPVVESGWNYAGGVYNRVKVNMCK